ncbi:MAG TPA: DUF4129 domain-containing protein [Pseudolysinimonas sp.]|nr:DUF4129 domain-containing protein [Pseudolysinimonas sp.]
MILLPFAGVPLDVPVDPDAPEAQKWILDELSKQPYQAAKPTLLDQVAQQILRWLGDLIDWLSSAGDGGSGGAGSLGFLAILIPVAILVVLAFLIYGVPRLNRRSRVTGALFGDDERRDAAAMRRAAERAAASGDYSTAIAELFRALARGLAERTLVTTHPGTTAGEFARRAAGVFPDAREPLATAARDFDAVRYLDHEGTREQWDAMVALEARLRSARPGVTPAMAAPA